MVSEEMDKFGILLNTHSTPALPSQREGRELSFRLTQKSKVGTLDRKLRTFPGKKGLWENGGRMKLECLSSIILHTSCVWEIIFGQYIGLGMSLKNCVLNYKHG